MCICIYIYICICGVGMFTQSVDVHSPVLDDFEAAQMAYIPPINSIGMGVWRSIH